MKTLGRPKSYEPQPGVTVRRDAENNIWRVFVGRTEVHSFAGTNGSDPQAEALAYALTLPANIIAGHLEGK